MENLLKMLVETLQKHNVLYGQESLPVIHALCSCKESDQLDNQILCSLQQTLLSQLLNLPTFDVVMAWENGSGRFCSDCLLLLTEFTRRVELRKINMRQEEFH